MLRTAPAQNRSIRQLDRLVLHRTQQVPDLGILPQFAAVLPRLSVITRAHHHPPPATRAGPHLVEEEKRAFPRGPHLEKDRIPTGVFPVQSLRSAGHLDRPAPALSLVTRDPDSDIRILLVPATEPSRHQAAPGLRDSGGMALRGGWVIQRVDEFRGEERARSGHGHRRNLPGIHDGGRERGQEGDGNKTFHRSHNLPDPAGLVNFSHRPITRCRILATPRCPWANVMGEEPMATDPFQEKYARTVYSPQDSGNNLSTNDSRLHPSQVTRPFCCLPITDISCR